MYLSQHKTYLYNGSEELKKVSAILQKNNSTIDESNKIFSFNKYPFISNIQIDNNVKEKLRKTFSQKSRDTDSILMSLISVEDINSGKRHHLLSAEIYNESVIAFYLNYNFLIDYMRLSRYTINLISKKGSIDKIVAELIEELKKIAQFKGLRINLSANADATLETNIDRLKRCISQIYGNLFRTDDTYFVFSVDNIKFKFASDYMSVDNRYFSGSKLLYNFYNKVLDNKNSNIDNQTSLIRYEGLDAMVNSQYRALKTMTSAVNLVIGAGGSGKTYLSKIIIERSIELNAILQAQGVKSLAPTLYTTFSKGSLEQFRLYAKNADISNSTISSLPIIYSRNVDVLIKRLDNLNENCDKNKYNRIERALCEQSIGTIAIDLDRQIEVYNSISSLLEYVFMSKDMEYVNEYLAQLEKASLNTGSFLSRVLDRLKIKLGIKEEDKIEINKDTMTGLFNTGKYFPTTILRKNLNLIIDTIKNKYLKNHELAESKFEKLMQEVFNETSSIFTFSGIEYSNGENGLTYADIIYYLKYLPVMKDDGKNIPKYKALLNDMIKSINSEEAVNFYKKVELKNGKTGSVPDNEKISLFYDLFPASADLVTNITDLDVYFDKIIADEAVLIPGVFTPMILSKTNSIIAMGDINQLELNLNMGNADITAQIEDIHSTDPNPYILSQSEKGQISLYNHLKSMVSEEKSLKLLIDNYRCRKEIIDMSNLIENKYSEYIERYKDINNLTDTAGQYYNSTQKSFRYNELDEIRSPFLFISDNVDRYSILETIIKENNIDLEQVLIIVPSPDKIPIVKNMLKNKEITVDILENIQGRDASIVVYDSFIDNTMSPEYKELSMRKFNLIITRTKDLFVFMGSEDVCFKTDISKRTDEASLVLIKFFRESKVNITKLSIEEN